MSSQICVDANIIVWSLVPFPMSNAAEALLEQWQNSETTLVAPALLAFEVTSTLRRLVYLKEIKSEVGELAFERFLSIGIQLSHDPAILSLAWDLARELNRSRAYDTSYLAVAQLNQCEFWTADQKLHNAVHTKLPWVKWLGNYQES